MEDLINQAFLHIEIIGTHVAEGHYDLVGPDGDIILPQVWETVIIEPDWDTSMHMWPIPEKSLEPTSEQELRPATRNLSEYLPKFARFDFWQREKPGNNGHQLVP